MMGYPKEVYRQAFNLLEERRNQSRSTQERRRAEIHEALPAVAEIERRMAATAASGIYAVVAGAEDVGDVVAGLGRENLALQQERARLLTASGYPADYLTERHECAHCGDTGYVGPVMCECLKKLLQRFAFEQIGDRADLNRCSFQNFDLSYYSTEFDQEAGVVPRKHMGDLLAFSRRYAEQFSPGAESLLMMGRTGQGKTHLSLAIAREATLNGFGVIYTPFQKLIDRLELGKFSHDAALKERYLQDLTGVTECDLLVLDDLGAEFATPFSTATAYNIINTRLVEQRATIVSTNLNLPALEKQYSARLASRLGFGFRMLSFCGEDIRFLRRING